VFVGVLNFRESDARNETKGTLLLLAAKDTLARLTGYLANFIPNCIFKRPFVISSALYFLS
jgi:hypothetical protein